MDAGIKGVCHYIKPEITYLLFIAVLGTKPKALYMLKKKILHYRIIPPV